ESVLKKSKIVNQRGSMTHNIAGGDELKNVIDDALEGFQMLISESFNDTETESPVEEARRRALNKEDTTSAAETDTTEQRNDSNRSQAHPFILVARCRRQLPTGRTR